MKTAKVIKYLPHPHNFRVCEFPNGKTMQMDLMVDGGHEFTEEELVGKTIHYDHAHPYLSIANGISVEDHA